MHDCAAMLNRHLTFIRKSDLKAFIDLVTSLPTHQHLLVNSRNLFKKTNKNWCLVNFNHIDWILFPSQKLYFVKKEVVSSSQIID